MIKNLIALNFVRLLMIPFEDTDAFKLGIIDKNGKKLKEPATPAEHDAYSYLDRVVFTVKRIMGKSGMSKLSPLAAAYYLVKESDENLTEEQIEQKILKITESNCHMIEEEFDLKMAMEEVGVGAVAANNTAGVEVKNPDAIPKRKKTIKDFVRRTSKLKDGVM